MSSVKQKRCKAIAAELPDGYRVAPWRLGGYAARHCSPGCRHAVKCR